jgi:hypothetical protein
VDLFGVDKGKCSTKFSSASPTGCGISHKLPTESNHLTWCKYSFTELIEHRDKQGTAPGTWLSYGNGHDNQAGASSQSCCNSRKNFCVMLMVQYADKVKAYELLPQGESVSESNLTLFEGLVAGSSSDPLKGDVDGVPLPVCNDLDQYLQWELYITSHSLM